MSNSNDAIRDQIQNGLSQLATLRDEVRVKLHLAGMDIKDAWGKLEPQLTEVEGMAKDVTDASRHAIDEMLTKVKSFQDSMKS